MSGERGEWVGTSDELYASGLVQAKNACERLRYHMEMSETRGGSGGAERGNRITSATGSFMTRNSVSDPIDLYLAAPLRGAGRERGHNHPMTGKRG